jgi:hypothetical protein
MVMVVMTICGYGFGFLVLDMAQLVNMGPLELEL